jgi:hypothetical protein
MRYPLVLSYEENEYLPMFTSIGHNLKEKNLFYCQSEKIIKNGDFTIVHGKIEQSTNAEKQIDLFLTYQNDKGFVRGFLYIDNKEYPVLQSNRYISLQIEKFCYDNILAICLPEDFDKGNHFT